MRGPTRRQFLATAAVAALAPRIARAAVAPPAITFGFSLYGMRTLPLDTAVERCATIGYGAVELAVMPDWPADPKGLSPDERRRLRVRLNSLGLSLPALMENTPIDGDDATHRRQLDRLKAAAQLGHDLSPDSPPLIETILGGKTDQWEQLKRRFADRLRDWAAVAEQGGTVIAIKAHRDAALDTPDKAVWLLRQVNSPRIVLDYDYSHFQHRDMPMAETLKLLLPFTRFIHMKDTVIENGKARFVLPGDGGIDYPALLKQVKESGYRGCCCVEVSAQVQKQKDYDPVAAARRSYSNLIPAFEAAGIRRRS
jgi:inosose dehydratase